MSVVSRSVVTVAAFGVETICAPGAVTCTGFICVVSGVTTDSTAVVGDGTDEGVSGALVASVIVAVLTLPVSWARTLPSNNKRLFVTEYRILQIILRRCEKRRSDYEARKDAAVKECGRERLTLARCVDTRKNGKCRIDCELDESRERVYLVLFLCHHGGSSKQAAIDFIGRRFTRVDR